jgi:inorganic triphosphatase YgiF
VQTVKQAMHSSAGMFDRPEWEFPVSGVAPERLDDEDLPLAAVLSKKERKKLIPVSENRVMRQTWMLAGSNGQVEATLDEGVVKSGRKTEEFAELELELKSGEPDLLIEIATTLARDVPLKLGVLTKDERGQRLADKTASKVAKAAPISLSADMTTAEGFVAIAHGCLRHFRLNEPRVIRKRDPDALHQLRVAMRRLRSAFSLFSPVVTDNRYSALREELRWFTAQLGEARNLDVLADQHSKTKGKTGKALRLNIGPARDEAYGHVIDALGSARLRLTLLELVGWMHTGEWRSSQLAGEPLPLFAKQALDRRWRKARKGGRNLAKLDMESLHQLRIEVKKLRYAIEFFSSLYGEARPRRHKAALAALAGMQEDLGLLNDQETARDLLPKLLATDPQTLAAASQKLEEQESQTRTLHNAIDGYAKLIDAGPYWR